MKLDALDLTRQLVSRASVTPADAGCQSMMCELLAELGFNVEQMPFGDVSNFWARRGDAAPLVIFAGHTDVVPAGERSSWDSDPFEPTETVDGCLRGRGTADMKASLAAMLAATARFIQLNPRHAGSIGWLITSDEEGPARDGTVKVIEALQARGEQIDFCIVGEPSSDKVLGDTIRNGRRGSLSGILKIKSALGHVAYPPEKENPMHAFARFVSQITQAPIDQGNEYFPPTTFQHGKRAL